MYSLLHGSKKPQLQQPRNIDFGTHLVAQVSPKTQLDYRVS